jgi:hypothetical protein
VNIEKISVTFAATIPTQAYGNVSVNVCWSGSLDEGDVAETETRALFDRIRLEVAAAVAPIAAAKLAQAKQAIESLPPREREALYQQLGVIQWLETVAPELKFAERGE